MKLLFLSLSFVFIQNCFGIIAQPVKAATTIKFSDINAVVSDEYAVWVGSTEGIQRIELEKDSIVAISKRQTSKPVLSMLNDEQLIWVGLKNKGVYLFDKKTYQFIGKFKKELGSSDVVQITRFEDKVRFFTSASKSYEMAKDSTLTLLSGAHADLKKNLYTNFKDRVVSVEGHLLFVAQSHTIEDEIVLEKNQVLLQQIRKKGLDSVSEVSAFSSDQVSKDVNVYVQSEKSTCNPSSSSSMIWVLISGGVIVYSVFLYFLVARKYKKDIEILEEKLLEELKKNK